MTVEQLSIDRVYDLAVAEVARSYVAAYVELLGATAGTMLEAKLALDWALHDLIVVCGEPCGCDPGTCPADPSDEVEIPIYYAPRVERVVPDPAYL